MTKQPKNEKISREIRFMVQPTLYDNFKKKCDGTYKTVSEVLRELMVQYSQ